MHDSERLFSRIIFSRPLALSFIFAETASTMLTCSSRKENYVFLFLGTGLLTGFSESTECPESSIASPEESDGVFSPMYECSARNGLLFALSHIFFFHFSKFQIKLAVN
jgi:hypothetical protein